MFELWPEIKVFFFFFNDTATTEIYTLSLHDALPISVLVRHLRAFCERSGPRLSGGSECHTSLGKTPQNREEKVKREGAAARTTAGFSLTAPSSSWSRCF